MPPGPQPRRRADVEAPHLERDWVSSEGGFVLVSMALMIVALLGMAGLAVDVANWYFQANRQQKAADAAALAGAVFLPADTTQAYSTAAALADKNGYKSGVASTTVTAQQESKPTRIRVTITRNINNFFGGLLGVGNTTIRRTSVAEFAGPGPDGKPEQRLRQ
jgi:Flp pilus assembly protein TadG